MRLQAAASALTLCLAASSAGADDGAQSPIAFTALDLLSLRQIGGESGNLSVSPDGRQVAFQLREPQFDRKTYDLGWYVAGIAAGGAAIRIAAGGDDEKHYHGRSALPRRARR